MSDAFGLFGPSMCVTFLLLLSEAQSVLPSGIKQFTVMNSWQKDLPQYYQILGGEGSKSMIYTFGKGWISVHISQYVLPSSLQSSARKEMRRNEGCPHKWNDPTACLTQLIFWNQACYHFVRHTQFTSVTLDGSVRPWIPPDGVWSCFTGSWEGYLGFFLLFFFLDAPFPAELSPLILVKHGLLHSDYDQHHSQSDRIWNAYSMS